jgi:hypothetical protein
MRANDIHSGSSPFSPGTDSSAARDLLGKVAPMLQAHEWVAFAVLVVTWSAGVGALAAFRFRRGGIVVRQLLALAQTVLVAQVGLGLLLLSDERRAPHELHYAYGTLALLAALAPWIYAPEEPRRRLLWFGGATLLAAALAVRAYMTGR